MRSTARAGSKTAPWEGEEHQRPFADVRRNRDAALRRAITMRDGGEAGAQRTDGSRPARGPEKPRSGREARLDRRDLDVPRDDLDRVGAEVGGEARHVDAVAGLGLHAEGRVPTDELDVEVDRVVDLARAGAQADDLARRVGEVGLHGADEDEPVALVRGGEERAAGGVVLGRVLDAGGGGQLLGRERADDVAREEPGDARVAERGPEGAVRADVGGRHHEVGAGLHAVAQDLEGRGAVEAVLGGHPELEDAGDVEHVHGPRRVPRLVAVLEAETREALRALLGHPVEDPGVGVGVERLGEIGVGAAVVGRLGGLVLGADQLRPLGGEPDGDERLAGQEHVRRLDVRGAHVVEGPGHGRVGRGGVEALDVGALDLGDGVRRLGQQALEHALEAGGVVAAEREHQALPQQLGAIVAVETARDVRAVHRPDVGDAGGAVEEDRLVEARVEHRGVDVEGVVGEERVRAPSEPLITTCFSVHLDYVSLPLGMTGMVSGLRMKAKII